MKIRTIRTYDEIAAFYDLIAQQYPNYTMQRLAHVHYGVFAVDDGSIGMGEGDHLVAGAAISVDHLDILQVEDDTPVNLDYLIVKKERRDLGIGTGLLKYILDLYNDRAIRLEVSPLAPIHRRRACSRVLKRPESAPVHLG